MFRNGFIFLSIEVPIVAIYRVDVAMVAIYRVDALFAQSDKVSI